MKKCEICKIERNEKNFYARVKQNVCKECLKQNVNYDDIISFMKFLKVNDLPYIDNIYKKQENLSSYIKIISSLPQYRGLTFKEGFNYNDKHDDSFITTAIHNLKQEITSLNESIIAARNRGNIGTYKNLIQAYERVMTLIERYDWKQMYSEYTTDDQKQIAVWMQNGEGQIKNKKVWNVEDGKNSNKEQICIHNVQIEPKQLNQLTQTISMLKDIKF